MRGLQEKVVALVSALAIVGACGGGGGGSSDSPSGSPSQSPDAEPEPTIIQFSGFSQLPADGTTRIEGEVSLFNNGFGNDPEPGSILVTTQGGEVVSIELLTYQQGRTFDPVTGEDLGFVQTSDPAVFEISPGDNPEVSKPFSSYVDGSFKAIFVDNESSGFEHQTFGVWAREYPEYFGCAGPGIFQNCGTFAGYTSIGVGSFGTRTQKENIPKGINANYEGFGVGYANLNGQNYDTFSSVNVSTDFNAVSVSSSGTEKVNRSTGDVELAPELDFLSSGTVSGSGFTARIQSPDNHGDVYGTFYGPNAEEVGGTFRSMPGPNLYTGDTYDGAFGGKR